MRAFITVALLSALALFDASFATPIKGSKGKPNSEGVRHVPHHATSAAPHDIAAAQITPSQAVAKIPASMHNDEPLPRRLSHRAEGVLPMGHRPADLGADGSMIPTQRAMHVHKPKDQPNAKRHDHINSPEAVTAASCNVGEAQCCQSIHQSQDQQAQFLSGLLGFAIPLDNSMVGVQCTPLANLLSVVGGSKSCSSQPICCTGNDFHGLINIGCSPISGM